VHQIDRRIGLQEIAPGALTGVRFAGNQKHPQALAHAVCGEHRAVVVRGEFIVGQIDGEFRHRLAAMLDFKVVFDRPADWHV
jgi:hypothetical protein